MGWEGGSEGVFPSVIMWNVYNVQTKVDIEFHSSLSQIFDEENLHYSPCFYLKDKFCIFKVHLQSVKMLITIFMQKKNKIEKHRMSHDSIDLIIQ